MQTQRDAADAPAPVTDAVDTGVRRLLASSGQQLDGSTRAFMEPRFGRDFSNVRVHAGAEAAKLATDLRARAFTVGSDIVFNRGEYRPAGRGGQELLAHELTHTVQQGQGRSAQIRRAPMGKGVDCSTSVPNDLKPTPEEWFATGTGLERLRDAASFKTSERSEGGETQVVGGKRSNESLLAEGSADKQAVMLLQRFLMWYFCENDAENPLRAFGAIGVFGAVTRNLVRKFQSYNPQLGLRADGVVGPFTLDMMDRLIMNVSPVDAASRDDGTLQTESGSLRWHVSGALATAAADGASLPALAKQVGGTLESIGCIRPISMRRETEDTPSDFEQNYAAYIRAGDVFDVGSLLRAERPEVQNEVALHFFTGTDEVRDAALAQLIYPELTPVSTSPDDNIHQAFIANGDPITQMVLYGHSSGGLMWGGSTAPHSRFDPKAFDRNTLHGGAQRTFTAMKNGEFTRNCWFAKSSGTRVLAIGCNSSDFGHAFATGYLRRSATVGTTTKFIVPACVLDANIPAPRRCTAYDSLGFSSRNGADSAFLRAMGLVRTGSPPTPGIGTWLAHTGEARQNLLANLLEVAAVL